MEQFTPFDRIFQSCGRIWHIRRADMDKLWAAMDQQEGEEAHLPYWNEIWPSSLALAGWLAEMQDDIRGRTCLDMGCGLGFTALLGRWLGADVTAMDYEPEALEYDAVIDRLRHKKVTLTGDGVERFLSRPSGLSLHVIRTEDCLPVEALAACGSEKYRLKKLDYPKPLYLRAPDVCIKA